MTTMTSLELSLSITANGSVRYNQYSLHGNNSGNATAEQSGSTNKGCGNRTVHDMVYDQTVRRVTVYILLITGILGGFAVFVWMWRNRRLKARLNSISRVNSFILNLTVADLSVMLFAVLPQLVWEYQDDRAWRAGEAMCKLIKFLQSFTMMASTNMLVAIAIDRHIAIRSPLKAPHAVWKMTGVAWILAVVGSLPMMYVFHMNTVGEIPKCENIFRTKPLFHRQAFLTYICVMVFGIPFVIITVCYIRIFLKIQEKVGESTKDGSRRQSMKTGKVQLQSTLTSTLPKAKIKTLKMTFVIVLVYIICGIPYVIAEMIMSYGDKCVMSELVYGLIGGLAAANSAANPYVFLLFNAKRGSRPKQLKLHYSDGVQRTAATSLNGARETTPVMNYRWSQRRQEKLELCPIK